MSNCKKVTIKGRLPFCGADNLDDKKFIYNFLGQCSIPSFGLKVEFDQKEILIPHTKGSGSMAVYPFTISGMETIGYEYITILNAVFKRTCSQYGNYEIEVIDVENDNAVLIREKSNIMPNASLA